MNILWTRNTNEPIFPSIPSSLIGYTDIFREYCNKLENYYVRRSSMFRIMFQGSLGSFEHLFVLGRIHDYHRLQIMLAVLYLDKQGYNWFKVAQLSKLVGSRHPGVLVRLQHEIKAGNVITLKRGRYTISSKGRLWLGVQAGAYYDKVLKLYGILEEKSPGVARAGEADNNQG